MAFVDDPNKQDSQQVAGSAPLSQGTPQPQSQPQGDSAPSQEPSALSVKNPKN